MNIKSTCPPADALAAFSFGLLKPEQAASIRGHIAECEACLETVGVLAGTSAAIEESSEVLGATPTRIM